MIKPPIIFAISLVGGIVYSMFQALESRTGPDITFVLTAGFCLVLMVAGYIDFRRQMLEIPKINHNLNVYFDCTENLLRALFQGDAEKQLEITKTVTEFKKRLQ